MAPSLIGRVEMRLPPPLIDLFLPHPGKPRLRIGQLETFGKLDVVEDEECGEFLRAVELMHLHVVALILTSVTE